MTVDEFAALVAQMRQVQREWKKAKPYTPLKHELEAAASRLEQKVDKALKERENRIQQEREARQPDLFKFQEDQK